MDFMIQTLTIRFIIFVFLISNIATSSKNSSVKIEKHIKIDTKKNICITPDNNINDGPLMTEKPDDNLRTRELKNLAIILILISSLILIYMCLYLWSNNREWCVWYIRNFLNTDPPELPSRIVRQPEPANYQDIYEMANLRVGRLPNMRATI